MDQHAETSASIVRQNFQGDELMVQHDTASTAVAARARAQIEARHIMALKRPRDWMDVRTRLLNECKRPGFARAARYRKPIGDGIEGPSIRFAEAAIRYMTNLAVETTVTYDDPTKVILRVSVTDIESNVPYEQDVAVSKTVERQRLGSGQRPISQRTNSYSKTVYLVEATDDEILNKVNALVSKALRTLALRLLPGDILDECMTMCIRVAADEDAKDPGAARKALVDAFFSVGISASQLAEYLGHSVEAVTPAEMNTLRAIYTALRDAETTWAAVMDAKTPGESSSGAAKKTEEILERHKTKAAAKTAPKAPEKKPEPEVADKEPEAKPEPTPEPAPAARTREPGEDDE